MQVLTSILVVLDVSPTARGMRAIERVARDEGALYSPTPPSLSDTELFAGAHLVLSTGPGHVTDAQQNMMSLQCESTYLDALLLLDDDITPVGTPRRGVLHGNAESADLALFNVMVGPTAGATTDFEQTI